LAFAASVFPLVEARTAAALPIIIGPRHELFLVRIGEMFKVEWSDEIRRSSFPSLDPEHDQISVRLRFVVKD
jgi:hypothetical protein